MLAILPNYSAPAILHNTNTMYKPHVSNIRKITRDDAMFHLSDGLTTAARAGFEISQSCPDEYKSIFITAINAGWIKPVAYMYDYEMTFAVLKDQS